MTNAILAHPLDPSRHADPSVFSKFFTEKEQQDLRSFVVREHTDEFDLRTQCTDNLFLGFFFDGTRNNYALSEARKDFSHSNVARLFDAYPGQTIAPRELLRFDVRFPEEARYPHFFRIYIPGVGTPFGEIGDSGQGMDRTLGAAFGRRGGARIVWALAQAINAVVFYFAKQPLLWPEEIRRLANAVDVAAWFDYADGRGFEDGPGAQSEAHFREVLGRLHEVLMFHIPDPATGCPQKVAPGLLQAIYVSAVGFSRGAAAARSFVNALIRLCRLDAALLGRSKLTLAGFPVTFDFLGLFDTVASVGLPATQATAHGHWDWAGSSLLRIPPEVRRTVHLVAAHEVRRSFPLDSINWEGTLPANGVEIVFPGVHSDVGGGYRPGEQGRGEDPEGTDLLSRIPLAVMYREARLAGMPLKLERAGERAWKRFRIDRRTLEVFNAYLSACPTREGTLTRIMREQMRLAILWRKLRFAQHVEALELRGEPAIVQEDLNDLTGALEEFQEECALFEDWWNGRSDVPGWDPDRASEWRDMAKWWTHTTLPEAMARLFEGYVHDSRAWFKLTEPEAEEWREILTAWTQWCALQEHADDAFARSPRCDLAQAFQRTGKVPPINTRGREPIAWGAGYLRYRRLYLGPDHTRQALFGPSRHLARRPAVEPRTASV